MSQSILTESSAPTQVTDPPRSDSGIQVIARAAEILRLLKSSPGGVTQSEIATSLKLARSTVHRILSALAVEGLVQQSTTSARVRLGPEILQMSDSVRAGLVSDVHPVLQSLSRELNETVDLSVLDRNQATFIDQVVANQRLRTVSVIGASFPLYCTANGKAILASLSESVLKALLPEHLTAHTPATLTSLPDLHRDLAQIQQSGVAYDLEEHSVGICAVGVALPNSPLGTVAISVPIPSQRFDEKRALTTVTILKAAQEISRLWASDQI